LLVAWPFLIGGGLLLAGILIPVAVLVAAGVLVWWLIAGEGPSGEPGDIARRAALGIGVLVLCGVVALGGALAAATGPDALAAILVIGAGAAIVAGAFLRPVRWLILPAVVLGVSAGTVSAAGIDLDGGIGERDYRPGSAADLRERYELGIGQLIVDLRDTDLPAGDVPLDVEVGMGEAWLIVPDDVCVATDAEVGMGDLRVFDRDNGGVDVDFHDRPEAPARTTRLLVDAQVGLGTLQVTRRHPDHDSFDRHDRFGFAGEDRSPPLEEGNTACATAGERAGE